MMKNLRPLYLLALTTAAGLCDPALHDASRDEANLKASQAVKSRPISGFAGFDRDLNHLLFYGQSLSVGADSNRALSVEAKPGNFMIGGPVSYRSDCKSELVPLLAIETQYEGEEPIFGTANALRRFLGGKPEPAIVASSCGTSGRAIEQLMKGSGNNWPRLVGAVQAAREIAKGQGKSYGVTALCWVQGESNYSPGGDWTSLKEEYKAKLAKIRKDFISEVATEQAPPIFISYQTGGAYSNDTNRLAVGMAQWELSKEDPGFLLATPVYPFTDYGGHLTANGYRWMGEQFAKVIDKVLLKGEGWEPLAPRKLQIDGRTITIDFHVPEPPLVFDSPYIGRKKIEPPSTKGFYVYDQAGTVDIDSVRLAGQTMVEIRLKRDIVGEAWVRYAGKGKFDGNGFLRDSDPAVAGTTYEFLEGSRQKEDEKISELLGKPYPLWNWCIAFDLKVSRNPDPNN